ncbi:flavin-containing monooxygenase FMO GS-OX5-like [Rutidosis leptorrhynchoides]|uniref:flavin-containing monooxygenase FMO GS-OX5-like n=1 Tax=Rutidosis leptorrhynchoides TaxID=125765 RepID=UPI003A9A3C18
MTLSLNVAVIGAGVSGLLTARELLRENHQVTVFEKSNQIGGTWLYDPRVEPENIFNLDPNRPIVHSSLYSSLRTNLPRPLMSFSDFSFEDKTYGDPRLFPGHQEVLNYLQGFANEFGVSKVIRFNADVVHVESKGSGFIVKWRMMEVGSIENDLFDVVVVCNGHNTEPRVANDALGIEKWTRKQVHSHNYRVPEPYRDQVVVVIGSGYSAIDISREIATAAKEVHLSSRSSNVKFSKLDGYENIWQHQRINRVYDDGTVVFQDDQDSIKADAILHCTGYKFHFPFLKTNNMVHVDDNRVGPLYKHIFPPQLAPKLCFIGLPFNQGALFPMFELQAKWVALVLSEKILLPSEDEMLADVYKHYREMEDNLIPKHYTHSLLFQFEYLDWLAAQVGLQVEDRLKKICRNLFDHWIASPNDFRNEFSC